ncbi:MAG: substrate import-associated zinc metallohydrolase lipoprotein [Bacteroidales bacterium]
MNKSNFLNTKVVIYYLLIGILTFNFGCQKEDAIPYEKYKEPAMPDDPTELAIYKLQKEYQTKIIYRFDRRYISADAFAAPPKHELVLPYINNIIRKVFIAPYERQATDFMLENMPIEMVMFGTSMNYVEGDERNFSASGVAYGLSRINITGVNKYDMSNPSWIRGQYATLHHEFAHVLDKKYGRPVGFDDVSKGLYAGGTSYAVFSSAEARSRGFWRNYGMTNESEDFATWIDGIVTTDKQDVLNIAAQNELLNQKYQLVYNFYLDLGIDLHVLQQYLSDFLNNIEE